MPHVFISYVRENQRAVTKLRSALESRGIPTWVDKHNISPGTNWKTAIRAAIRGGGFFLACFSEQYGRRRKTYMNTELGIAIEELTQFQAESPWFIPVLLSNCELPDLPLGGHQTLRDLQFIRLYKDWDLGVEAIVEVIQPSTPVSATPATHSVPSKPADEKRHATDERVPRELWDGLWARYETAKDPEVARKLLQQCADSGDPRVGDELRRLPKNEDNLWIAIRYPIAEYVEHAIDVACNETLEGQYARQFLNRAAPFVASDVLAENLAGAIGTVEYLGLENIGGASHEATEGTADVVRFLHDVGVRNGKLRVAVSWIYARILELDLQLWLLCDTLEAARDFELSEETISKCRERLLTHESWCVPFGTRKQPNYDTFFGTTGTNVMKGLRLAGPGAHARHIENLARKFLESRDLDELFAACRLLESLSAPLDRELGDRLQSRISELKHSYTEARPAELKRLIHRLAEMGDA